MILTSLLPQDIGILRQHQNIEYSESNKTPFKANSGLKPMQNDIKDSGKMARRKHSSTFEVSFLCNRAEQLICIDKITEEGTQPNLQAREHHDLLAYYGRIQPKTHCCKQETNIDTHVEHHFESQFSSDIACVALTNTDIHKAMSTDL